MIKLDKTKSYYLGDLSEEQRECVKYYLVENYSNWNGYSRIDKDFLYFSSVFHIWLITNEEKGKQTNALELFYTLENVQVDCRELSEEQIKEMFDIYVNNGYGVLADDYNYASKLCDDYQYYFLKSDKGEVFVGSDIVEKHTITYDKFMELFSKEENVLTEIMKDEYKPTFCETYKSEKPQHYSKGIDTFKRMEENCTLEERLAFAKGNIDKYTWRTKGQDKEDFEKIISYAKWAIKQLEK